MQRKDSLYRRLCDLRDDLRTQLRFRNPLTGATRRAIRAQVVSTGSDSLHHW